MFEYGLVSSAAEQLRLALLSTGDTIVRYGGDLLRLAVDDPLLFLLMMTGLVVMALFARLR